MRLTIVVCAAVTVATAVMAAWWLRRVPAR